MQYASSAVLDTRDDGGSRGRRAAPPGRRARRGRTGRRPKDPLWAKLLVVFGALIMLGSGTVIVGQRLIFEAATSSFNQTSLLDPAAAAPQHATINGAKNVLLVGIDARPNQSPTDPVRSDSIIIVHIPATHDRAYLVSIPRDTFVDIPAYNNGKQPYRGGKDKINAAFAYGGQGLTGLDARRNGFVLLQKTIKQAYGITFDAGAIVDFEGFQQVVSALGGVSMNVDELTQSIHIGYNAKTGKQEVPSWVDANTVAHHVPGVIPKTYKPGYQHLAPWEALDYVRQRDWIQDGDYGRQRHQQQFIKAVFREILSTGVLTNPAKLSAVLDTVGKAMTVDSGGISLEDWIFAMRNISAGDMMTIKTNNGQFHSENVPPFGQVETLDPTSIELMQDIHADTVDNFVLNHSDWVSQS